MNIFVLDEDPLKCAKYHCDKHVVKMILESAQMMCTVLRGLGYETPYQSTHIKHPCTLWLQKSLGNWRWHKKLVYHLNDEYMYRYNKSKAHASISVIDQLPEPKFDKIQRTEFVQAMPDKYKVSSNAVAAYRKFYIGDKKDFCTWTKRRTPRWFAVNCNLNVPVVSR